MKIHRILILIIGSSVVLSFNTSAIEESNPLECFPIADSAPIVDVSSRDFSFRPSAIRLKPISTCRAGFFNSKGSEIVAHDPKTQRLFVVNVAENVEGRTPSMDILDIRNPNNPKPFASIDLAEASDFVGVTVPTSVAVKRGIVAVTVGDTRTGAGKVLLFNSRGNLLRRLDVGFAPDMVTFTPNGRRLLTANQGVIQLQPPPGQPILLPSSVSIIDMTRGVQRASVENLDFSDFNDQRNELLSNGVRLIPETVVPGFPIPVAQSLIPAFIAVSPNSRTAWVTLEVNNALAVVDIKGKQFTAIRGLGVKDHSLLDNGFVSFDGGIGRNALDASDMDAQINIANWPVFGMYQPDAIAAYRTRGGTFLVTANEGNSFADFDQATVESLPLDPISFPNAEFLKQSANLGRLRVSNFEGLNQAGQFARLFAFGARSFSIWSQDGSLRFDSGDDFEQITAMAVPDFFNTPDDENVFDGRSDNQGPEPEGVTTGKILGRHYAFVVLERIGGIMVYDITNPNRPRFQQYVNNRNFDIFPKEDCPSVRGALESAKCREVGDLGPEGVLFIPWFKSPIFRPLVVVANETSGSTTIFRVFTRKRVRRR